MTIVAPKEATLLGLARTLLLLRDHVRPNVSDATLAEALLGTRVALVGDSANLCSEQAQHALVATAMLAARSGASVHLVLPDVPLSGSQPPLRGDQLGPVLLEVLADLIPGVVGAVGVPVGGVDLAILIGDTSWSDRATRVLRLQSDAWSGAITSGSGSGGRWTDSGSPFGALAAAGLAAGEAFKAALGRLRDYAINWTAFDLLFAPTREAIVELAPARTPSPTGDLGAFDCISGGAIVQAALYALARIPGARGAVRIVEPDVSDMTNLNRNALLRRSRIGMAKAVDLAEMQLGEMRVTPIVARYDSALRSSFGQHAPSVLVGVDDIPTRWEVQAARPSWLGVGATTHYSAMASYHVSGLGCARCLHPRDEPGGAPIPTVGFVSHWAGLWLASLFARERIGARPPAVKQCLYFTSLRADSPAAIWVGPVQPRADCPLKCATWK